MACGVAASCTPYPKRCEEQSLGTQMSFIHALAFEAADPVQNVTWCHLEAALLLHRYGSP